MAQLVERHLAKVEVAGSTPVARSKEPQVRGQTRGWPRRAEAPDHVWSTDDWDRWFHATGAPIAVEPPQ